MEHWTEVAALNTGRTGAGIGATTSAIVLYGGLAIQVVTETQNLGMELLGLK